MEDGRIVLDEPADLPEGAEVAVALLDDNPSAEERAEIEAAIDEGLEQAARGDTRPFEEVLQRLRAR